MITPYAYACSLAVYYCNGKSDARNVIVSLDDVIKTFEQVITFLIVFECLSFQIAEVNDYIV